MLNRRNSNEKYSQQQSICLLTRFANMMSQNSQSVFMLEQVQPDWLSSHKQTWLYYFSVFLATAFPVGLFFGLSGWMAIRWGAPYIARIFGIGIGLAAGLTLCLAIAQTFTFMSSLCVGAAFGVAFGIPFRMNFGISTGITVGLSIGIVMTLTFGLIGKRLLSGGIASCKHIKTVEKLRWSWSKSLLGVIIGLIAGAIVGFIIGHTVFGLAALNFGIAFGVSGGLLGGLLRGCNRSRG
jgi:eukaryotic-like serine/threonine-protein kinase